MNKIPLVITSDQTHPYIEGLRQQDLPIRIDTVSQAEDNWQPHQVVFIRSGYESESDPTLAPRTARLEMRYRNAGCKIVNGIRVNMLSDRKDILYPTLKTAGFSVPRSIPNPTIKEIEVAVELGFPFPFVVRTADQYGGKGLRLVHSLDEAAQALIDFRGRRKMVVEYVEDKVGDYNARCRVYVVGGKVDVVSRNLSRNWVVAPMGETFMSEIKDPKYIEAMFNANVSFELRGDIEDAALRIGRGMGAQVYAVDFLLSGAKHYFIDLSCLYYYTLGHHDIFPEHHRERRRLHFRRVAEYLNWLVDGE